MDTAEVCVTANKAKSPLQRFSGGPRVSGVQQYHCWPCHSIHRQSEQLQCFSHGSLGFLSAEGEQACNELCTDFSETIASAEVHGLCALGHLPWHWAPRKGIQSKKWQDRY